MKHLDNILEPQLLNYVNLLLRFKTKFKPHWSNAENFENGKMLMMNSDELTDIDNVFVYLLDLFENKGLLERGKFELKRSYANLNFAGENHSGDWHTDTGFEGSDGSTHTILFYPQYWETKWDGETLFKNGDKIDYKQNSVVIFDGTLPHKANAHSNPNSFRFTLAYKVKLL